MRLWDTASGQLKAILQAGSVVTLAFSPDGKTLATASSDPTVELWDVASGQLKVTLNADGPLAFSPDGQTLAGVGWNDESNHATVRLWEVASGRLKATLEPSLDYSRAVDFIHQFSLAFSSDGKTLAAGGRLNHGYGAFYPGPMQLWDVASGKLKIGFDGARGPFAFAPDGKTLATEGYDSTTDVYTVRLWDVASGQLKATLKDAGWTLAFSPDSRMLATGSNGGVRLWEHE